MSKKNHHTHHTPAELAAAPQTPPTRADCPERSPTSPCPHLRCRYHLGIQAGTTACALDHADDGPMRLEDIGALIGGVSRARTGQIIDNVIARLREEHLDLPTTYLDGREISRPDLHYFQNESRARQHGRRREEKHLFQRESAKIFQRIKSMSAEWGKKTIREVPRAEWPSIIEQQEQQACTQDPPHPSADGSTARTSRARSSKAG